MRIRAELRSPWGPTVVRDVVRGRWEDPAGDPDEVVGGGLWAVPGLVDAHAHFESDTLGFPPTTLAEVTARAQRALAAGVLLALDKGGKELATIEMMERVPPADRPEMEAAGHLLKVPGGYYDDIGVVVEPGTMSEVVTAEALESRGWIKLIGDWPRAGQGPLPNFDQTELEAAVRAAEASGARVAIHTMARDVPSMAVAAGVHSIEHGPFLTEDDLDALAAREGIWVPTVRRVEETMGGLREGSSGVALLAEGLENVRRVLPHAVDAGVIILTGTDLAGPPGEVGREALRLVDYGLPVEAALAAVSVSGFRATGRAAGFEPGTPADAVFFTANPMDDLGALAHPALVMRLGALR